MKVEIITLTDKASEQRDYGQIYAIDIDGKSVFLVSDGEPEDANLSRDFNDVVGIPELLQIAHKAGTLGESLEISYKEVEEY